MKIRNAFIFIATFLFAFSARAMSLQPALFDLTANPGETRTETVSITNDESAQHTYYFSIQKFIPSGTSGQQEFLPPSETSGLPSWIFLDRPSVTLRPGETARIPFSIRVPANTLAGGYYAAIFFGTEPPGNTAQGQIVTGARTGALILLTVKGPLVRELQLQNFSLESPAKLSRLPISFQTLLQNTGNVHIVPEGSVTVKNIFGNIVARLPINPQGVRVLPSSDRRLLVTWQKEQPRFGSGFWHEVGEEWSNFAIGPYAATLQITGPGAEKIQAMTVHFSVWPWDLLIVIFGGLVGLLILAQVYRRWVIYRATVDEKPKTRKQ